jgi:hypothetical protein
MPSSNEWFAKFKDPRWQRKRLEVMRREDFACQHCGTKEATLNVHHSYYKKDLAPWEYPDESLRCLCENCHLLVSPVWGWLREAFGMLPIFGWYKLLGYAIGLKFGRDAELSIDFNKISADEGLRSFFGEGLADSIAGSSSDFGHSVMNTVYQRMEPFVELTARFKHDDLVEIYTAAELENQDLFQG